jgi:hypothetical protein
MKIKIRRAVESDITVAYEKEDTFAIAVVNIFSIRIDSSS